jgi:hypothetical protein
VAESVSAPGRPALLADLDDLAAAVADTSAPDREAAQRLAQVLRGRAPRRTGRMADGIYPTATTVEVPAPYAPYVAARNPFVTDSIEQAASQVEEPYARHLEDAPPATLRTRY